jgi:predicted acyl esterase
MGDQASDTTASPAAVKDQQAPAQAAPAVRGLRVEKIAEGATEVIAPMRDRTKLAGNLYLPEGEGPFPCIVTRTPYGKDQMELFADPRAARKYTKAGYAYLVQDTRGKGRSEGHYAGFSDDRNDGYDTIEWMAKQSWCNGKVGVTGASAMGITSNMAAIAAPPHLVAAFVIVAGNDTNFVGGAFKQRDMGDWHRGQGVSEERVRSRAGSYAETALSVTGDVLHNARYIHIPVYNYGGWYDLFSVGNVRNFQHLQNHGSRGARGNQKLEMGPFGHGELAGDLAYPNGSELIGNKSEIRWFDYWLKGIDNGIMEEPPVRVYMMAAARKGDPSPKNRWLQFANWPPGPQTVEYFLHEDGGLSRKAPTAAAAARGYDFDPADPAPTQGGSNLTFEKGPMDQRAIGERGDYLRFQTPVLERDVVIAGPVSVELWASTDGPDTDFMVKLVDVYPDGYEAIVLDAALRTRYRHGRHRDDIRMMTPGAPEKLTLDLWDTAITFEQGHRIALHVTSSNSPRFDVNPNTGELPGRGVETRVARNVVHLDAAHPSALRLPVIYLEG